MSLARNTFVQFVNTMLSRLLGFARDRIIYNMIGAGMFGDAWAFAQNFPNLFRRLLAEGAFSQAFVPIYTKTAKEKGEDAASELAAETFPVLTLASLLITIIAEILMPWVFMMFKGHLKSPESFQLTVLLTQITMPYLVGMSASSLFAGVLNAKGRFALSAAAPTILNITILAFIIFTRTPEKTVLAASWALTASGVFQALLLYWGCRKMGLRIGFRLPRLTPDVKLIMKIMIPAIISGSAVQINSAFSSIIAGYEEGGRSWIYNAGRLYQLPLGLIGVAIGVALMPRIARALTKGAEAGDDIKALNEGFVMSMALTLPATAALMAMPFFMMHGFWTGGLFHDSDSYNSAQALFHLAWGVPASVLIRIFLPAYYARHDSKTPMNYALVDVGTNLVLSGILFYTLHKINHSGYIGLAIAASVAAWANALLLAFTMLRRGWWHIDAALISRLLRICAASLIMGIVLKFAEIHMQDLINILGFMKHGAKEIVTAIVCMLGFILYFIAAFALKAFTIQEIKAGIARG